MVSLEERLAEIFKRLKAAEQATLLSFAEFLLQRSATGPQAGDIEQRVVPDPEPITRPKEESVVAAVKRLSRTYPMLDKSKILNETSALVGEHVMQGREAPEVIDDLEVIFQRFYRELRDSS